jgi:RNA 2',3'-cyclic 3'-phosphodiesterase
MEENKSMRCFIALDLPREAMDHIEDIQKVIKKQNLFAGKFTEVENLHLTLKFLGEISEGEIEKVKEELKQVKFKEFEARLGEIGVFSSKYSSYIRVIWIKLDGKGIFSLQKEIDKALDKLFPVEQRFMSHITIARVKNMKDKRALLEYIKKIKISEIKFKVDKFFLKKSELLPEGPIYEDLAEYTLEKEK